jgi:segregation and condensation protein B
MINEFEHENEEENQIENDQAEADSEIEDIDPDEVDGDDKQTLRGLDEAAEQVLAAENGENALEIPEPVIPLRIQIEALLFASPRPLKATDLMELVIGNYMVSEIDQILESLKTEFEQRPDAGFKFEYVKGFGYQFQTVKASARVMEKLFTSRPRPLSRAALETMSIIAYRQPVTRAAIEFIRGVDSGSIINNLMERDLIKCVGRKEDAGRPMLFGTTEEFLKVFGVASLSELPPLQAFQPSTEVMADALKELESIDEVKVEEFVGDQDEAAPAISNGLLEDLVETSNPPQ